MSTLTRVSPGEAINFEHTQRPFWCVAPAILFIILLFHRTAWSMVEVWMATPTFNHGFFIVPAAIWFVWRERNGIAGTLTPFPIGMSAVLAAGLVWLIGDVGGIGLLTHIGFVGMIVSTIVTIVGLQFARLCWFPLLFLGFTIPAGEQLVPALQQLTATSAVLLIQLAGLPVWHDGIFIQTPTGQFRVAEACAGLRFLIATIVVSNVFSYLNFQSAFNWALFLSLGVLVPIVANIFRATGIIFVAHWTDNEYATGVDHLVYGWFFFAFIILLLLFLGGKLARAEKASPRSPVIARNTGIAPVRGRLKTWPAQALAVSFIAAGIACVGLWMAQLGQWQALSYQNPPTAESPWHQVSGGHQPWVPVFPHASANIAAAYSDGGPPVQLHLAVYASQSPGKEVIGYPNRFADGDKWNIISSSSTTIAIAGRELPFAVLRMLSSTGERQTVFAFYWVAGRVTASAFEAKAYQIYATLLEQNRAAAAVAIAVPVGSDHDAKSIAKRFLASLPSLPEYIASVLALDESFEP